MIGSIALLAALLATTPPPRPRVQPPGGEPELDLDLDGIDMPDLDLSRLRQRSRWWSARRAR